MNNVIVGVFPGKVPPLVHEFYVTLYSFDET